MDVDRIACSGSKSVRKYDYIQVGEKHINAKSIMGMMSLSLADGEEITVVTDGEDEQRAAEGIKHFLTKGRK